ncbi:MAG: histone deacetylase family protein [Gammaproteobacteria bacterium]|jgi:acetoin utilization deacetylase AcuC-like enzyme/GNAT superfamily N-acetyltransferase
MFRIRRVFDVTTRTNQRTLAEVRALLHEQLPGLRDEELARFGSQLTHPLEHRFQATLFVAEGATGNVKGFALLSFAPDLHFCFLDYIASAPGRTGAGVGSALYQRVREQARALGAEGVFFECLPDDPALSPNPAVREQNRARLKFYERFGARPLANTRYETPVNPGDTDPPYLVFDDLGSGKPLSRTRARTIVRAILVRKYGELCPREYSEAVVASITDDPVRLRAPHYVKTRKRPAAAAPPPLRGIALVVNERHRIHHVRERGYVESPVRIVSILEEIEPSGLFERTPAEVHSERHVRSVHAPAFVDYLKHTCATVPEGKSVYPYVFPIRNRTRPPREMALRAGYYCIDTFTPINRNAWPAARGAVDCALTAADCLLDRYDLAYALVRPPGHHAERRSFGGFCYLNSAAVAAHYLSHHGRVATLDIDYHHGNGTQDIFYRRDDVLTVSLHGHPRRTYPYFSGFEDETGEGPGQGFNLNLPMAEGLDGEHYRKVLNKALRRIHRFRPVFLVVSFGLDTARGDPTGSFQLRAGDFHANGRLIGALGLPTLLIQEGGYKTRSLGVNARHFFNGLWTGHQESAGSEQHAASH